MIGVTVQVTGTPVEEANFSYATIQRSQVQGCSTAAEKIKEGWVCEEISTIQWDGKKMQSLGDKYTKQERIQVVVTGIHKKRS